MIRICFRTIFVVLGALYSVLTSMVMAQEPVGKAGAPQKLAAPAKEEVSPAPAKVEFNSH